MSRGAARDGDTILGKSGTVDAAETEPVGADGRLRRSIREIREVAYRAIVARGASHGEAVAAADAVQHAEVQHGTGVAALVADLASGPWPQAGLRLIRSGSRAVASHADPGDPRSGPLRAGQSIIDCVAGAAAADGVEFAGGLAGTAPELLESPLLDGAAASGRILVVIDRSDGAFAVRCAAPDGGLGSAPSADERAAAALAPPPGSERTALATLAAAGIPLPEHGASLVVAVPVGAPGGDALGGEPGGEPGRAAGGAAGGEPGGVDEAELASALAWTTPEERAAIRRDAAVHGLRVDAEAWRALKRMARAYLQPEREDPR